MAYVEVLGLNAGQRVTDAIDDYLNLHMQGLTWTYTTVDANGRAYPIGYFDDKNIELFRLGVTTVDNISFLVNRGFEELGDEIKIHTNHFIDQLFENYDEKERIPSILKAFSKIVEAGGHKFLDQEQWDSVQERADKKKEGNSK
ncbi:MAG: hypothetical protein IJI58_01130 [Bacilli bacterium]|nr:hypothetical protein [Bacilli bacterium]